MINGTTEFNNKPKFSERNCFLAASAITALVLGTLVLVAVLPRFNIGVIDVVKGEGFWSTTRSYSALIMSPSSLVSSVTIVTIASIAIGFGLYGISKQLSKIFHIVKHNLAVKVDEGKLGQGSIMRNTKDLLDFMDKSKDFHQQVKQSKLGRLITAAFLIGAVGTGLVLVTLGGQYFAHVLNNAAIEGGFAVYPLTVKLALTSLVAGGVLVGAGGIPLIRTLAEKRKKKPYYLEAINEEPEAPKPLTPPQTIETLKISHHELVHHHRLGDQPEKGSNTEYLQHKGITITLTGSSFINDYDPSQEMFG